MTPSDASQTMTAAEWATAKNTPAWQLVVATAHQGWPQGQLLTESEFEAAIDAACTVPLR